MTRDRYGEEREAEEPTPLPHRCDRGWLDRDADHPRPCLLCRPWLAQTTDHRTLTGRTP